MRIAVLLVLLLAACTTDPALDPDLHGREPAEEPNVAGEAGSLNVTTENVNYYGNVEGYLARPAEDGAYPGVVMIHEWWGLNDNIRTMADRLASEGYVVLAVDLFNGSVATTPEEARSQVQSFEQEEGLENMRAAVSYLRGQGVRRVASLGWCFGGGQSLQAGLAEDLDATVIYYGNIVTERERLQSLEQPVLGIFGEEDESIPVSEVEEFDRTLDDLGVRNEIRIYENAGHAFANPSGDRYVEEAAEDAWQRTTTFLAENLQ